MTRAGPVVQLWQLQLWLCAIIVLTFFLLSYFQQQMR